MIKILIADDSATETILLKQIIETEKDMCVIGCACNGKEAVELAEKLRPDLITMDIQMPIMNGFEATKLIMMNTPIPIVVISSTLDNKELNVVFLALEAGAVTVIDKPIDVFGPSTKFSYKRMINLIRGMAEIKVIKRRFVPLNLTPPPKPTVNLRYYYSDYEIIAIGASVGGPQALKVILSALPANFPIPIVIIQHITAGFLEGLCQWLNDCCSISVRCAKHQECLQPGTVYFAPEHHHLEINRIGQNLVVYLHNRSPIGGFCPSITVLLQSIATTCSKKAIGILLTGMGNDGAQGLLELKQKHGHTIIQDPKSCVVFGMANVAQSLGAVDKVVELDQLVNYLIKLVSRVNYSKGEVRD